MYIKNKKQFKLCEVQTTLNAQHLYEKKFVEDKAITNQ